MNRLTERQIGYLAALIDGEGTICLSENIRKDRPNNTFQPKVSVCNTNLKIVQYCLDTTGLGRLDLDKHNGDSNKRINVWQLHTNEIVRFLTTIQPALIAKAEQAELLLEYYEKCYYIKSSKITDEIRTLRSVISDEIRELNRRGT